MTLSDILDHWVWLVVLVNGAVGLLATGATLIFRSIAGGPVDGKEIRWLSVAGMTSLMIGLVGVLLGCFQLLAKTQEEGEDQEEEEGIEIESLPDDEDEAPAERNAIAEVHAQDDKDDGIDEKLLEGDEGVKKVDAGKSQGAGYILRAFDDIIVEQDVAPM